MKWFAVILFVGFILTGCNHGYESLEEAVQVSWNTPIEVINQDEKNKLVYYLDQNQHILGVYEYEAGKYRYDNQRSVGMIFDSEVGLPFFVSANHFEGVGDIIHGAIESDAHNVEKFVLHYKNGETQELAAHNNTFIAEFPPHVTVEPINFFAELDNAIGYDSEGEVIEKWRRE